MTALHRAEPQVAGPLPGPKSAAWLERDARVMSPSYTRMYPLVVRRAKGAMMEDLDGNRFLDFTAGIAVTNAGHCHPKVTAAIRRQAGRLVHMSGTDFYYTPQVRLAETLARLAPGSGPKRVFFTNSGAEAIEAALKLARHHTGRPRVMAFLGAFHGRTYGAMSLDRLEGRPASRLLAARAGGPPRPLRRPGERPAPAQDDLPARRAGGDLRRADPGRRRLPRAAARRSCPACGSSATSTASCSSSTRSRPASAGPAGCSPPSTGASPATSSAWPRGSPTACPWARSSPEPT